MSKRAICGDRLEAKELRETIRRQLKGHLKDFPSVCYLTGVSGDWKDGGVITSEGDKVPRNLSSQSCKQPCHSSLRRNHCGTSD